MSCFFGGDDDDAAAGGAAAAPVRRGSVYDLGNGDSFAAATKTQTPSCDLAKCFEASTPSTRPRAATDHYESPYIQWSSGVAAELTAKRKKNRELRRAFLLAKFRDSSKGHNAATHGARSRAFERYAQACRRSWDAVGLARDVLDDDALDGTDARQLDREVKAIQTRQALNRQSCRPATHLRREISEGLDKIDGDGDSPLHRVLDEWHRDHDPARDDEFLASCLAGADLDVTNDAGLVPLMLAIKAGNSAAVCALLHLGASYHTENAQGFGPLLLAAELGQATCFALLVARMRKDNTLRHRAARQGDGYTRADRRVFFFLSPRPGGSLFLGAVQIAGASTSRASTAT